MGHSAERDAGPSWMRPETVALYEKAEALAEQRGCVIENDCWIDCIDAALEEVSRVLPPGVPTPPAEPGADRGSES